MTVLGENSMDSHPTPGLAQGTSKRASRRKRAGVHLQRDEAGELLHRKKWKPVQGPRQGAARKLEQVSQPGQILGCKGQMPPNKGLDRQAGAAANNTAKI